jgi:hypothetical protein
LKYLKYSVIAVLLALMGGTLSAQIQPYDRQRDLSGYWRLHSTALTPALIKSGLSQACRALFACRASFKRSLMAMRSRPALPRSSLFTIDIGFCEKITGNTERNVKVPFLSQPPRHYVESRGINAISTFPLHGSAAGPY